MAESLTKESTDSPPSISKRFSAAESAADDAKSVSTATDDLVDHEPPPLRWTNYLFNRKDRKQYDPDEISTRRSVYDDPDLAANHWPNKNYENLHRFDPKARWTYREEQVSSK